jgi:hypothetical protein
MLSCQTRGRDEYGNIIKKRIGEEKCVNGKKKATVTKGRTCTIN